ncbi:MAG: hypothetical protein FJ218_01565 [Ignavibacteria bacterium]|nr:hypothetical protein [Ignavibacteria bacterium]
MKIYNLYENIIYVGTLAGFNYSTNGGATFQQYNIQTSPIGLNVASICATRHHVFALHKEDENVVVSYKNTMNNYWERIWSGKMDATKIVLDNNTLDPPSVYIVGSRRTFINPSRTNVQFYVHAISQ